METLKEFGQKSYFKAHWNDFKGALEVLDVAIRRFPNEEKLYNNRSYVLFNLGLYKKALEDANLMVEKFPLYPRSHYRKGEICMAMKMYDEAIIAFEKVLKLNPECKEARLYHQEAMISYLCCNGKYLRICAIKALNLTHDVTQAKQFLANGGLTEMLSNEDLYQSDEDNKTVSSSKIKKREPLNKSKSKTEAYDPLTDPTNPYKSSTIWVGNVTEKVTESILKSSFKKFGTILNCCIQHKNYCAFVNYTAASMATNAMRDFPQEGMPVADTTLVIRFPDSAKNKPQLKQYTPMKKRGK